MKRLVWLDIAKGLAILWVVYFHFFKTYRDWAPYPMSGHFIADVAGAHGWDSVSAAIQTIATIVWYAISGVGFHAVGLFIIVSGWSLASATAKREAKGPIAWGPWYRARFIRLYPMYWLAHLVYLVSPFQARLEPIDWRFLISLTGLRMIDISMNFMYLNAAWWYFSMLIQLYLLFPLLYMGMRKFGLAPFLVLAFAVGFITRYLLLNVWHAHGGLDPRRKCIVPAAGVRSGDGGRNGASPRPGARRTVAPWRRGPGPWSHPVLLRAILLQRAENLCIRRYMDWGVLFPGGRRRRGAARKMVRRREVARAGRSVLVWHLSRAPAVCHLGGTSNQTLASMGIPGDFGGGPYRAQRLGDRPREICECRARKDYRRQEKAGSPGGIALPVEAVVPTACCCVRRLAQPPLDPFSSSVSGRDAQNCTRGRVRSPVYNATHSGEGGY